MTSEEYMQRLVEISEKKYGLLSGIQDLTHTQSGIIAEKKIEELGKIIEDKQEIIDEIDKLDEEFNVYFQRLKKQSDVKNLNELNSKEIKGTDRLKQTVSRILEKANEISETEKQNNDKAKELLNSLSKELNKLSDGKKINSAYKPKPPQSASYYFDKKK